MADDHNAPAEGEGETRALLQEVVQDAEVRAAREKTTESLKNRVSVAAIILTTALSFISNVRSNRQDAIASVKEVAEATQKEAAELWAFYQTGLAERTSVEVGHDQMRMQLARRGAARRDPSAKLQTVLLDEY